MFCSLLSCSRCSPDMLQNLTHPVPTLPAPKRTRTPLRYCTDCHSPPTKTAAHIHPNDCALCIPCNDSWHPSTHFTQLLLPCCCEALIRSSHEMQLCHPAHSRLRCTQPDVAQLLAGAASSSPRAAALLAAARAMNAACPAGTLPAWPPHAFSADACSAVEDRHTRFGTLSRMQL
jgi:hypothetical protein